MMVTMSVAVSGKISFLSLDQVVTPSSSTPNMMKLAATWFLENQWMRFPMVAVLGPGVVCRSCRALVSRDGKFLRGGVLLAV